MSKLNASRNAQWPLAAEFTFNFDDTMVNTANGEVDFGKANLGGAAGSFDIINLPEGAVVVGGDVITETAFDTASFAVVIGDAGDADRYLASADRKAVGRAALTPTGDRSAANLRLGFTSADVCTAGKMTVRIQYVIPGRANEVVSS